MQKLSFGAAISFAAAALLSTAPAHAELVSAKKPEVIKKIIEANGWPAKLNLPKDDDPYIESERNDLKFLVMFMSCDDKHRNCTTIKYYMGFSDAKDTTLEQLNEWNKTKRFGRAFRDDEGDAVIEMDVDLDFNGLPRENVEESLNIWSTLMDTYWSYLFE